MKKAIKALSAFAILGTLLVGCSKVETIYFMGQEVGEANCSNKTIFLYPGNEGALDSNTWYTLDEAENEMAKRTDWVTASLTKEMLEVFYHTACESK